MRERGVAKVYAGNLNTSKITAALPHRSMQQSMRRVALRQPPFAVSTWSCRAAALCLRSQASQLSASHRSAKAQGLSVQCVQDELSSLSRPSPPS